jgi:hypothetical protein
MRGAMTLDQLENCIPIVRGRLDDELEMQSEYYWQAAKQSAYAVSRRDDASAKLKEIDATIYKELNVPEGEGGKLPSDAKILRELALDVRHLAQERLIRQAQLEVNLWTGMVESFNKRNAMLGRLGEMMVSGILQRDSIPGPRSEVERDRRSMAAARHSQAAAAEGTGSAPAAARSRTSLLDG